MNFKRGLAFALAAVMACAALPACSKTENASSSGSSASSGASSAKVKNDPWELDFTIPGGKDSVSTDNSIGQYLKNKFNVTIKITGYSGDYSSLCAGELAAGNYPEMMMLNNNTVFQNYVKAGALKDMGALAKKYAPNMLTFYKDQIPLWQYLSDADGKMYCFTADSPDVEQTTGGSFFDMCVRSDIIKEQNYPTLLDEDSYINLLKKGLAAHPKTDGQTTLGMVQGAAENWVLVQAMTQIYARGKYGEGSGILQYDPDTKKKVDLILDSTNYKEGIRFWNKMWREGILDKECFTDKDENAEQKLETGRALSTFYVTWELPDINKALKAAKKSQYSYVIMPIMLKSQIADKQSRVGTITDAYTSQTIVITKNSKNYDKIMQIVNWACTEEGQNLLGWGIKGKHYTVGTDGLKVPTAAYIACANGTGSDTHFNDGLGNLTSYFFFGLSSGYDKNGQCYNIIHDTSVQNAAMDNATKDIYSHYGWTSVTDPWKKNKQFSYKLIHSTDAMSKGNSDAQAEENVLNTKLGNYRDNHLAGLIMASSDADFEAKWANFVAGYKAIDPKGIVKQKANEGYKETQDLLKKYKTEGLQ